MHFQEQVLTRHKYKFKAVEENFETLVKENEANLQEIARLKKKQSQKLSKDQESQTKAEGNFVEILCTECIFLASLEDELNWHMGEPMRRTTYPTLIKISHAVFVIAGVKLKRN